MQRPIAALSRMLTDDGSFTVFNSRTNETKRYGARR